MNDDNKGKRKFLEPIGGTSGCSCVFGDVALQEVWRKAYKLNSDYKMQLEPKEGQHNSCCRHLSCLERLKR